MPTRAPTPLSRAIGERIRMLRAERGMTQETVAYEREGSNSKGHLSNVESGKTRVTVFTLASIANQLRVHLFDLFVNSSDDDRSALVEETRGMSEDALRELLARARELRERTTRAPVQLTADAATRRPIPTASALPPAPLDRLASPPSDWREARKLGAVPLRALDIAAGGFQPVDSTAIAHWIVLGNQHSLSEGHFVARVTGRSMEPIVPNGAYALFASPVRGDLNGRILLIQSHDFIDSETGASYTLKRFAGRRDDEGNWIAVRLVPANPAFSAIEIDARHGARLNAVAEFVRVVSTG